MQRNDKLRIAPKEMNNLFRHIEYLLIRHDCVILPGFGAFIATSTPARIDTSIGKIYPPARTIMFNHSVTVDDGMLASSIARKQSLSFEEARQVMVNYVRQLKATLEERREISVGKIGTLTVGEEGNILFMPAAVSFGDLGAIGLSPVSTLRHTRISENSTEADKAECEGQKAFGDKKRPHKIGFRKRLSRYAAALAVAAVAVTAVIMNPFPHDTREQRASVMPVEALNQIRPAKENNLTPATTLPEQKGASISEPELTTVVTDTQAVAESPKHYLIVGTFKTAKEAERFVKMHTSEEYPLETVASRRVTRVAVASSTDKNELLPLLNSSKISRVFPNSWIWSE